MNAEIRRTTVTPTEDGNVVQLHISDAPPEDPSAAFVLQLHVSLPRYAEAILLAQAQREALEVAQDVLSQHLQTLARDIHGVVDSLRPALMSNQS